MCVPMLQRNIALDLCGNLTEKKFLQEYAPVTMYFRTISTEIMMVLTPDIATRPLLKTRLQDQVIKHATLALWMCRPVQTVTVPLQLTFFW